MLYVMRLMKKAVSITVADRRSSAPDRLIEGNKNIEEANTPLERQEAV